MAEKTPMRLDLLEIAGAALGGALAYLLTTHLPGLISAMVCAAAIAALSFASSRTSMPALWWAGVGAIAGSVIGTGTMLAGSLAEEGVQGRTATRYTIIGTLAVAGFLAGIFLGKEHERTNIPHPAELLKRASGLTLVLFALIVTVRYPSVGLEKVRSLSSRLSTTVTILATAISVPGWIGFAIGVRIGLRLRSLLAQHGVVLPDGTESHDSSPRQPAR